MRYVLMIGSEEGDVVAGPAEHLALPEFAAWNAEMQRRGVLQGGERLRPSSATTTVRVRDGETLLSDGPFAEAKEHVGGYAVIECADLDEAIEVASKHPMAGVGTIEIRPVWEP